MICSTCKADKPESEFYVRWTKLKGGGLKQSHQSRCKECNNKKHKAAPEQSRRQFQAAVEGKA